MTGNLKAVPYTVTIPAVDEYDFAYTVSTRVSFVGLFSYMFAS